MINRAVNITCISPTTQSLEIGQELNDDKIVGQALTGLCRAALRDRNQDQHDHQFQSPAGCAGGGLELVARVLKAWPLAAHCGVRRSR